MAEKRKISKAYRRIMQCGSQVSVSAVSSPKQSARLANIWATIFHGAQSILRVVFFPLDWMDDHFIDFIKIIIWVLQAGVILFSVFVAILFTVAIHSEGGFFGWFGALASTILWLWLIRKMIRDF